MVTYVSGDVISPAHEVYMEQNYSGRIMLVGTQIGC
jgi:hypothetical protein